MFCVKCGTPLPDGVNFCFKCGCDLRNLNQESGNVYSAVKAGDYVKFGSYTQNDEYNKQPIEWLVLEVRCNEALLISRYCLDCRMYHRWFNETTWENCDLRKWLNADFLKAAFSEGEQQRIKLSEVVNDDNPEYGTRGGNNTRDRVFCLSFSEAERYFNTNAERKCRPTALAKKHSVYRSKEGYCWWWLRSPGLNQCNVSVVSIGGVLDSGGHGVDIFDRAVRPALWLKL